jgi:hypothetical protein
MVNMKMTSSEVLCHVFWQKFTNILEVLASSIIRALNSDCPDDGGSKYL